MIMSHEIAGGIAARASDINTETAFALNLFDIPIPSPVEELLVSMPDAGMSSFFLDSSAR
jgi:hypothetical protein